MLIAAVGCAMPAEDPGRSVGLASEALSATDCPVGYNIIQGTNASETLIGTAGNDCIVAKSGNDTVYGRGGNDFLIGGDGSDTLYGEAGSDVLHGEAGADRLEGGDGNDTLYGGLNIDSLYGQNDDDQLYGDASGDTLEGGLGNDFLRGGDGDDILRGGDGDDHVHGEAGGDMLYGDAGYDILFGGGQADKAWGGAGDDAIHGGDANDNLYGEAGDDALIGGAGTNTSDGGPGTDACSGVACELPALVPSGCTQNSQCSAGQQCITDFGLCLGCVSDQDGDGTCDSRDGCPVHAGKTAPGVCGCAVSDADGDGDGTVNCVDGCPADATKVAPGVCGCGVSDADSDGDGTPSCNDGCPTDASKTAAGVCGCGVSDVDSDGDGTPSCNDGCPADASKTAAGVCGCGVSDLDTNGDGMSNCDAVWMCDAAKVAAGACGCGVSDADGDGDGAPNCQDACPSDAAKVAAGACGCGVSDVDTDSDGVVDCHDVCEGWDDHADEDQDGTPDGCDTPVQCTASSLGNRVHQGDVILESASDVAALSGLVCVTGSVIVGGLASLQGLEGLTGIAGNLQLSYTSALVSLDGLDGLQTIGGDLQIRANTALANSVGLASLQRVGGSVEIAGNTVLGSVDGLEALSEIGGSLQIADNALLANLAGLSGLQHVAQMGMVNPVLSIEHNPQLPQCWVWSLQQQLGVQCGQGFGLSSCSGNTGSGSCGDLPQGFGCVPGARGPGVYDGTVSVYNEEQLALLSGMQCITGSLLLNYVPGADLSVLSQLRSVGGTVMIYASSSLTSLHGLENLRDIGWNLSITANSELTSLAALSGLTSVGAQNPEPNNLKLSVTNNAKLPACAVWQLAQQLAMACGYGAQCDGNRGQGSCGTLPPDFACVPGAVGPGVYDGSISIYPGNPTANLDDFGGLTCVTGSLMIDGTSLTDLSALSHLQMVGIALSVGGNTSLASLSGLENLRSVGGSLNIWNNDALQDLSPLSQFVSLGGGPGVPAEWTTLQIMDNDNLPACWTWSLEAQTGLACGYSQWGGGFVRCSGNHGHGSCGTLPPDFACVPGATGPGVYDGSISIYPGNPSANLDDFGGLTCVTGSLMIDGTTLTDLSALSHLQMVGVAFSVGGNTSLASLSGLENLRSVGGSLNIWNNDALQDLSPLSQLVSLGGGPGVPAEWTSLQIMDNDNLPACWTWSLEAQTGLACGYSQWGGGFVRCSGNHGHGSCGALPPDFACVPGATGPGVYDGSISIYPGNPSTNLDDFGGVACITGSLMISESSLADLQALSSLQRVGGYLSLGGNDALTSLSGLENLRSIGGALSIWDNDGLADLSALSQLTSLAAAPGFPPEYAKLRVDDNDQLSGCWVWSLEQQLDVTCGAPLWEGGWQPCAGNHGRSSCGTLPVDFACIPGATGPGVYDGSISMYDPLSSVDLREFGGVRCVTGSVQILSSTLTGLGDLSGLQMIGGSLGLGGNPQLLELTGLEQLTSVGRGLTISNNPLLASLAPLSNLVSLGEQLEPSAGSALWIADNVGLPECWQARLEQQTGELCQDPQNTPCQGNEGAGTCD